MAPEHTNPARVRNLNDDPHNQHIAIETTHTTRTEVLTTLLSQDENVGNYSGGLMPTDIYRVTLDATESTAPAPLGATIGMLKQAADALGYEVRFTCHKWQDSGTAYLRPLPDGDWPTDASDALTYEEATDTAQKPSSA